MADDSVGTDPAPVPQSDRNRIVALWKEGGPGVKAAAEAALIGTDAAVRKFLDADVKAAQLADDRVSATQIHDLGGRAVRAAAVQALNGTPEDLQAFLATGWQAPLESDQRMQAAQLRNGAGRGVQEAGRAAINGSIDDIRNFLNDGQYTAREADDRVQLVQILSTGGPNTQAAARLALNGSIQDVRDFLDVGQHVAHARDAERASVSQLIQQAKDAAYQAVREGEAAKQASAKAVESSALAKQAAATAAAETQAAQNDTAAAGAAADRAAQAATRAGEAAQVAIVAAKAATNSARTAASAAAQAAAAAAAASQAAARARSAAANAATDRGKAKAAREASEAASLAAQTANWFGDGLDHGDLQPPIPDDPVNPTGSFGLAKISLAEADKASAAADDAGQNAYAAAVSASQAGASAGKATAQSARAKQAAASTTRHAQEASRAAAAAGALVRDAKQAVSDAQALVASAATHASAAAKAAAEAALHAGESATATAASKANAQAAAEAAQATKDAVAKARTARDLADRAEAEDLTARTAAALEKALDARAAYDDDQKNAGEALQKLRALQDEANRLATAVAQPGTPTADIVTDGRKLALLSMKIAGGPWEREASAAALSGSDQAVLDYVRNDRHQALEQDERDRVANLAVNSEIEAVRTAATEALKGDAQTITAFLSAGQYESAASDLRAAVARTRNGADRAVDAAARAAINAGTAKALHEFMAVGYAEAQASDDNLRAAQLRNGAGPELEAAARVALQGSPQQLQAFLQTGQYAAKNKDALGATHKAEIERLLLEGDAATALAQQSASEAAQAAAIAAGADSEARAAEAAAKDSAGKAASFAAQAQEKAKAAEASANQAVASAKTASDAEATARRQVASATLSAKRAQSSATTANWAAASAYRASVEARASWEAAKTDADGAAVAATKAWQAYKDQVADWERIGQEMRDANLAFMQDAAAQRAAEQQAEQQKRDIEAQLAKELNDPYRDYKPVDTRGLLLAIAHGVLDFAGMVLPPGWSSAADLLNCGLYALQRDVEHAKASCISAIPIVGEAKAFEKAMELLKNTGPLGKKVVEFIERLFSKIPGICEPNKNSFPAGTSVLMGDGSRKPIEKVKVGDTVLATDPDLGRTAAKPVEAVIYTPDDRNFTDLQIQGDQGTGSLTATGHHPFWVEKDHKWVDAADLNVGDTLRTPNGPAAAVTEAKQRKGHEPTYNLTVRDVHTFYVLAGPTAVLVHNVDCFAPFTRENIGAIATKVGLKPYSGSGPTTGFARAGNKIIDDLSSGREKDEAALVAWVKTATKELRGTVSGRASDLEVKFVAKMHIDGIDDAELVINMWDGPCVEKNGCNETLDGLLSRDKKNPKGLTVYFPNSSGAWDCLVYGTHRVKGRGGSGGKCRNSI
ncbi:polymorphic toxin-type HINT domain-containing protein [Kitasatospora brasiliensis]|uniref:polymorphic toxin-type HINT domain-containing protein n=1 Tax=Kitasatospora brasiliensis TaxID=3058040 RepID=UPI0029310854|nr:polymorphic toxin-type HINT domain-containing protein [Kitasatospora sp. K002]